MKKRLYLLRHAQASSMSSHGDKDRALTDSGLEDAAALGKYMCSKEYLPALTICSSATRTMQTFEKVGAALKSLKVQHSDDLYNASFGELIAIVQGCVDENSLMIVGHNPAIYELAGRLSENGADQFLSRLSQGFHPATLAVIDFEGEHWAEISPECCTLVDLVNPLDYNAPEKPTRWM